MTADRRDARFVLPGEWVLPPIGVPLPGMKAGEPGRVHHIEVLPAVRRDIDPPGPAFEVALCLLRRGAHPAHTAGDARRGDGFQEHLVNPGTQGVGARPPEPWPILWLPLGELVEVVPPPPRVRVVWTDRGWDVIREAAP